MDGGAAGTWGRVESCGSVNREVGRLSRFARESRGGPCPASVKLRRPRRDIEGEDGSDTLG